MSTSLNASRGIATTRVTGVLTPPRFSLLGRCGAVAAAAAIAAVLVALVPASVGAQSDEESAEAYVAGAEAWTESDCAGDVPIVVGSDDKAQSDIYSAITLAGAIDTDCVILAGARDDDMSEAHMMRLKAANKGGYIVGGEAAVPAAKVAGRDMMRIAGTDRWTTAQQVGAVAAKIEAGDAPKPPSDSDSAALAESVDAHIMGAEGWFTSDCKDQTPIVVGSDATAQSDIYSAITLAGVIGTDCVILAGARGGDMPEAQMMRLEAARSGGYVVGGEAAVPATKLGGRDMMRLAGTDRWTTAQKVGERAAAGFVSVATGGIHTCAVRTNGEIVCWGGWAESDGVAVPSGDFKAVASGSAHTCALSRDGTVDCWGVFSTGGPNIHGNEHGQADEPDGTYDVIAANTYHTCAIQKDGRIMCWGYDGDGQTSDISDGTYTAVSNGYAHSCALRQNKKVTCWGNNDEGQTDAPKGTYMAVSAGGSHTYAVTTGGKIVGWGSEAEGVTLPQGNFTDVSTGSGHACALRKNGELTCWGNNEHGQTDVPDGTYTAVATGFAHTCAIRTNGTITCWGDNRDGQTNLP